MNRGESGQIWSLKVTLIDEYNNIAEKISGLPGSSRDVRP